MTEFQKLFQHICAPKNRKLILRKFEALITSIFRFGSARRQRKEINLSMVLLAIVVLFFLCHACRIILDIYEFSNMDKVINCPEQYR